MLIRFLRQRSVIWSLALALGLALVMSGSAIAAKGGRHGAGGHGGGGQKGGGHGGGHARGGHQMRSAHPGGGYRSHSAQPSRGHTGRSGHHSHSRHSSGVYLRFGSPLGYGGTGYGGWGYGGFGYGGLGYSSAQRYGYPSYRYGNSYNTYRPYTATPRYPPQYIYVQPSVALEVPAQAAYAKPQAQPSTKVVDPSAQLRPGMVLPDGAIVVSVDPISEVSSPDPSPGESDAVNSSSD